MKTIFNILTIAALAAALAFGQTTTPSTTLSAAVAANATGQWCVASSTGIVLPSLSASTGGTILFVDSEAVAVTSQGSTTTCYNIKRGQLGTSANAAHASGAKVWIGQVAVGTGDTSRPFNNVFVNSVPTGTCTASAQAYLPVIYTGPGALGYPTGTIFTCAGGRWGPNTDWTFFVPPTNCTFAPTTLTTTNTYPQVGASNIFVLNGTSNAAAGTNTLVCTFALPSRVGSQKGAVITDITLFVGSQTTAPTSLGTSTLGTITFPAAASSETASTVTPVATGGTVTTTSPSQITTVTTAGSFLTIKHTYSTAVTVDTDLQVFQYTMPFVQSAASAMTINTPGLLIHGRWASSEF